MEVASLLMPILQEALNWNRARIKFLAHFLIALIKVKTVNLSEIAVAFGGKAKAESNYKRMQRFFRSFVFDFTIIALLIARMVPMVDTPFLLTLDRTNWKVGKVNINILVLAIAYRGIAFPIVWILLPKRGNSNTKERKLLMARFLSIFSIVQIQCLTADREFIGEEWFSYLLIESIPFRIRIRENMWITNSRGIANKARDLFRHLAIGQSQVLSGQRMVDGHRLFVIGLRLAKEYVIIVTASDPHVALEDYARRWEIASLFSCLKTRGFRFEETHLTDPKRIEKLVAILAIAFAWAHTTGEWLEKQKPIAIKKHGRKAISLFRLGLNHLRKTVVNFTSHVKDFIDLLELLSRAFSCQCKQCQHF